jgi:hypothetical protein
MEWRVFIGWLETMRRQIEGVKTSPDSWAGSENDAWYQEQRRKREEQRARR